MNIIGLSSSDTHPPLCVPSILKGASCSRAKSEPSKESAGCSQFLPQTGFSLFPQASAAPAPQGYLVSPPSRAPGKTFLGAASGEVWAELSCTGGLGVDWQEPSGLLRTRKGKLPFWSENFWKLKLKQRPGQTPIYLKTPFPLTIVKALTCPCSTCL